jgi:hypothetical protein
MQKLEEERVKEDEAKLREEAENKKLEEEIAE